MKKIILLISLMGMMSYTFSQLRGCHQIFFNNTTWYHKIPFDSACIYISNFLQYETLREEARQHALGGIISVDRNKIINIEALKIYPCYTDRLWILRDEVFVAYEIDSVNPQDPNCNFVHPGLSRSNDKFRYTQDGISRDEIAGFLINQKDTPNSKNAVIDTSDVSRFNGRFYQQYTANGDSISQPKYHCGALSKNEIDSLTLQTYDNGENVIGFRYFFGYDRRKTKSKLRLVLIAVKQNGENLIYQDNGQEAIILERHWPPD